MQTLNALKIRTAIQTIVFIAYQMGNVATTTPSIVKRVYADMGMAIVMMVNVLQAHFAEGIIFWNIIHSWLIAIQFLVQKCVLIRVRKKKNCDKLSR